MSKKIKKCFTAAFCTFQTVFGEKIAFFCRVLTHHGERARGDWIAIQPTLSQFLKETKLPICLLFPISSISRIGSDYFEAPPQNPKQPENFHIRPRNHPFCRLGLLFFNKNSLFIDFLSISAILWPVGVSFGASTFIYSNFFFSKDATYLPGR